MVRSKKAVVATRATKKEAVAKNEPPITCVSCEQTKWRGAFSKKMQASIPLAQDLDTQPVAVCWECLGTGTTCARCSRTKPTSGFSKLELSRLKGHQVCKLCSLEAAGMLLCSTCHTEKPRAQFGKEHKKHSCQSCLAKAAVDVCAGANKRALEPSERFSGRAKKLRRAREERDIAGSTKRSHCSKHVTKRQRLEERRVADPPPNGRPSWPSPWPGHWGGPAGGVAPRGSAETGSEFECNVEL